MSYFTGRLIWVLGHHLVAITTANFGYKLSCEGKWARLLELSETWSQCMRRGAGPGGRGSGWEEGCWARRQKAWEADGGRTGWWYSPYVFIVRI